jgi:tripartite-type tricarboxylate transporter receptor subunit TctC
MNHSTLNRRTFLGAAALAPFATAWPAFGETAWPSRAIRIIVPFVPGAFTDVSARLVAQELSDQLGQPVIVENRGGAGGTIGTLEVVRSAPDGYTLLLTDTSLAIAPGLYPKLNYDVIRDLTQISRIAECPSILLVRPGLGPKTAAELVDYAKKNPGKLTFGSGGPGSSAHLAMELFLDVAGIKALHVPFRGVATAITETVAGHIDMTISSIAAALGQVKGGTLLGLAVSGERRSALLPDVPTFIEAGFPRYDMVYWWGIAAPARISPELVTRLNREVVRACDQPRLKTAFLQQAAVAVTSTPEDMTAQLKKEVALWHEVITRANVTIE